MLLHLDDPLTMALLEDAMSRLKTRKVGGLSEILPELVLCVGPVLLERLLAGSDANCLKGGLCV